MGRLISIFIFQKILGWTVTGYQPARTDQYVAIAIPHTSNWDFFLGVFSRSIHRIGNCRYLGKSSLFIPPFGWLFRWLGGYPVKRDKSHNYVQSVVKLFKEKPGFAICVAPEGTRKYTNKLKTGFYYIALEAQVPIILVKFDYAKKNVDFSTPFHPTGDFDKDMSYIVHYFRGVVGYNYTFDMEYPWKEN